MDRATSIVWAIVTLIIAALVIAGSTYACTNSNNNYYRMVSACAAQGGTFVPQQGSGTGYCFKK